MTSYIDKIRESPEGEKELRYAKLYLEITEIIHRIMDEQDISRAQLADKTGKKEKEIEQMLDGETIPTLSMLSDIADSLGYRLVVDFQQKKKSNNTN